MRRIVLGLLLLGALAAPAAAEGLVAGGGRGRAFHLHVPKAGQGPRPLLILLHGVMASSTMQELYMEFAPLADREGFLYAYPDGSRNEAGGLFWHASDACCNLTGMPIDDVAFLDELIAKVEARDAVDPARIYVVGHSNGGFMAHRMACRSKRVAAIAALSGAGELNAEKCGLGPPVSVLHIHGVNDEIVPYNGTRKAVLPWLGPLSQRAESVFPVPSVVQTLEWWRKRNGCEGPLRPAGPDLDLDAAAPGAETAVLRYDCPRAAVEHWRMQSPGNHLDPNMAFPAHVPTLYNTSRPPPAGSGGSIFAEQVYRWLASRRRQ